MDKSIAQLIQEIHDHPAEAVVVVAGAGTQALAWLFGVAGASRTMLEARVPYAAEAFREFIGREPRKYVSAVSARLLAGNALGRATRLKRLAVTAPTNHPPLVGLACTATISTDYVKRGDHQAFVTAWTAGRIVTISLVLAKGTRGRPEEEELVSRLIINGLAEAAGLDGRLPVELREDEALRREEIDLAGAVDRLLAGASPFVAVTADGRARARGVNPEVLLAGSFNPLHEGHTGLAAAAAELLGRPVAFELSVANVDKPPLAAATVLGRLAQFAGRHPVYLTGAPTFLEKCRLFPGTTFVTGYDTAARILAPRYYGDSREAMLAALSEMRTLGCRFVVAGRADDEGRFREADDLAVPAGFEGLFVPLPAGRFRRDISSTALRRQAAAG